MNNDLFCPNCGTKIKAGGQFCPNCGTKIKRVVAKSQTDDQPKTKAIPASPQRTKMKVPFGKKNRQFKILLLAVAVVLVAVFFGLKSYYQPQKQLDRIITAFGNPSKDLSGYVTTDDPNLQKKINATNLKPVQKYFSKDHQKLASLKAALEKSNSYQGSYSLQRDGSAWLFFPKYKVNISAVYVKLYTNHANFSFYKNSQKVGKTTQDSYSQKVGPLFPGTYTFTARGTLSGRNMSKKVEQTVNSNSKNIHLNITTASLTLHGHPEANVYFNHRKIGQLNKNGTLKLKNYPIKKNMTGYTVYNSGKKKVRSKTINITLQLELGVRTISFNSKSSSSSSKKTTSTVADASSSSDTTDSSVDSSDSSDSTDTSNVDTKNLTTDQVNDWILVHLKSQYNFNVTKDDFEFEQAKNDQGILEITVYENHDGPDMQAHNADPETSPRVGTYSINSDGNLYDEDTNQVISTEYGK
ncbi:TcaA 3rd/4th domain-containing protein [Liquorilactobacillus sicerae]|uniref:TcaA 3rd/4th domain-containing protein n=1 Tax=Liquorilactobacillus sicerae TaxID=1416943 RepID=UPI00248161AB|nr:zinc-ribbon domain-containing protein [Liquorilactobacillus sicerae]